MTTRPSPSYGTPNWEMIDRWMQLDPVADGPFWALNLMRYHPVAQYADGEARVSGKEADDAYAPLGPLAAVGAAVAFHGDVLDQRAGEPSWDRIAVVRYPSRAAFLAMQQRDDFRAQHVHKEAGMAFTIVMACLPTGHDVDAPATGASVLVVEADAGAPPTDPVGSTTVAAFAVEGVIVGDERTFARARFLRAVDGAAIDAIAASAAESGEAHVMVLDPAIDHVVATIVTAPGAAT